MTRDLVTFTYDPSVMRLTTRDPKRPKAKSRRRDPRSLLELRRLVHRASRNLGAREVLHDALLETFPEQYAEAIEEAHREVREWRRRWPKDHRVEFVIFFSTRMLRWKKLGTRPHLSALFVPVASPFTGFMESPPSEKVSTETIERYLRTSRSDTRIKSGIIVYRTRGPL